MELELIKNSILDIRGKRVILDYELAKLYEVETKYLKRTVRNNLIRFPTDFMFELSSDEWKDLRCKNSTSSWGGQRYPPYAFTEQGVAMLSGLLNSNTAIHVNISIMRAFVLMRQWALEYQDLQEKLIKNSILDIRGKRVILDYELAKLYGIETKRLKESVRRNLRRFPEDFRFANNWKKVNLKGMVAFKQVMEAQTKWTAKELRLPY
jgi:hypothetical protein